MVRLGSLQMQDPDGSSLGMPDSSKVPKRQRAIFTARAGLGREPASQQSPHVHLGALDERLTEAPVEAGAALAGGFGSRLVWINHDHEDSDCLPRGAAPASFVPSVFHME